MPLNLEDRRKLIDLLSKMPPFQDVDGRRSVLNAAGLEIFIPRVNFSLATEVFVGLLVSQLEQYGTMEATNEPALFSLLRWADDPAQLGVGDRSFVRRLLGLPPLTQPAGTPPHPPTPTRAVESAAGGGTDKIVILFLAASPTDQDRLRSDQEYRAIDENLRKSDYRDKFKLEIGLAVQVDDLQELLLRHKPHIVHFSGHGSTEGIVLEDHTGRASLVPPEALSDLFEILHKNIRCVVLNACLSEAQARGIAQAIEAVVGMSQEIGDSAAIAFASAFYQGLGYGEDILTAFRLGVNLIRRQGLPDGAAPHLICREGVDARSIKFA